LKRGITVNLLMKGTSDNTRESGKRSKDCQQDSLVGQLCKGENMKLTDEEKNMQKMAQMVLMNPFIPPGGAMSKDEAKKLLSRMALKELEEETGKI